MSRIIADLQGLIVPHNEVAQGTVTGISFDVVSISSPNGPKNFKVTNPGSFSKGDKVRYQGELFLGKVSQEVGIPHHSV